MSARTVAAMLVTCTVLAVSLLAPPARGGDLFGSLFGDFYDSGPDAVEPARTLACRGTLSFGDALARAVRMTVDTGRREITTPECRKYPHLARFCAGTLIRIGDHHFVFGGAESWENTKLWADLRRPGNILTVAENGTDIETLRVLFAGRCTPAATRNLRHASKARDP